METIKGTVILKILKASLLRDTEIFAKMAPYCAITIGSQTSKTTVKKNYGKTPEWFEVFSFSANLNEEIKLKVWDKDALGKDDLVAEGSLTNKKEFINMKYCFWVPLKYKNVASGQIQIDIEFIPNHESLNFLMNLLQTELKEKEMLLNQFEKKPNQPNEPSEEVLNSKEATTKKIQELNEQINQLKIEFQTKCTEIQQQIKMNTKIGEELKQNVAIFQKDLLDYRN